MTRSMVLVGLAWLLLSLGLGVALFHWRTGLVEAVLPLLAWVVEQVETRMTIAGFTIIQRGSEQLLELRLVCDHPITLYGREFPYMDVSATTLVTHALQHYFIVGLALLSGLLLAPRRGLRLLPLLLVGLLLSLMLDLPFTLLGSIEGLLLEHLAPQQLNSHPLVFWERFMTQGGRMVTALGISLLCLNLAGVQLPRWQTGSPQPQKSAV